MVAERKDKSGKDSSDKGVKSFVYVETIEEEKVMSNGSGDAHAANNPVLKSVARPLKSEHSATHTITVETSNSDTLITSDSDGRYAVQLASFPDFEVAKEMERTLKSKTYPAYVEKANLAEKGTWYRVKVGKFTTKEEASKLGNEIKTAEPDVKSILVTLN